MVSIFKIFSSDEFKIDIFFLKIKCTGLHNPIDAIFHFQPVMALTMCLFSVTMEGKYQIK